MKRVIIILLLLQLTIPCTVFSNDSFNNLENSIVEHDFKKISSIIKSGVDANCKLKHGLSPLIVAIINQSSLDTIKFLCENGANVNMVSEKGMSPLDFLHLLHLRKRHESSRSNANVILKMGMALHIKAEQKPINSDDYRYNVTKYLLEKGADPNKSGYYYGSPVQLSFENEKLFFLFSKFKIDYKKENDSKQNLLHMITNYDASEKVVKFLIDKGIDINQKDKFGNTPLCNAVEKNINIIELLLENKADPNVKTLNNSNPLFLSLYSKNSYEKIKLLKKYGDKTDFKKYKNQTPLIMVINYSRATVVNKLKAIKLLLELKANVNNKDNRNYTPLHYAVENGNYEIAKLLLKNGANVNAETKYGFTPLSFAVYGKQGSYYNKGNIKIVKLLIENDANIFKTEKDDNNLLYHSLKTPGNFEITRELLKYFKQGKKYPSDDSAINLIISRLESPLYKETDEIRTLKLFTKTDINFKDKNGMTPLHYAAKFEGALSIVKFLIKNGANVNLFDNNRKLPFHYGINNKEITKEFINNKTDLLFKDNKGKQFLHYAVAVPNNLEIVKLIVENGGEVNSIDNSGKTPLHYAVQKNFNEVIVKYLLNSNADKEIKDKDGKKPSAYAKRESIKKILDNSKLNDNIDSQVEDKMIFIKGGMFQFQFGKYSTSRDGISSKVAPFFLGKHEVTFDEFKEYCESIGRSLPFDQGWGKGKRPVINISWYDAVEFCDWKSLKDGLIPCYNTEKNSIRCDFNSDGYRLPTEIEWEYAARECGKKIKYGNGKNYASKKEINCDKYYNGKSENTGSYFPNELGLYDMSGNVGEWCWDYFDLKKYKKYLKENPMSSEKGNEKTVRGGDWLNKASFSRTTSRMKSNPQESSSTVGFRLCRTFVKKNGVKVSVKNKKKLKSRKENCHKQCLMIEKAIKKLKKNSSKYKNIRFGIIENLMYVLISEGYLKTLPKCNSGGDYHWSGDGSSSVEFKGKIIGPSRVFCNIHGFSK